MSALRPLGIYIHWPYCARICPYCDFNVVRDRGREGEKTRLLAAIAQDLMTQAEALGPRNLVSIYFGGGTPSLMDPAAAGGLIALCGRLFPSEGAVEVTLEANPTDAETDRLAAFADAGVNRLSLGVQALDDASLVFLGRNHDAAEARRGARRGALQFKRLSIDLIYALPGQSAEAWALTLQEVCDLGAEHVSPYELTLEENTPFHRAVRRDRWRPADAEQAAGLFEDTQRVLGERGFDAYEVSNHAKAQGARCRHNLIYWRGEDYLGVGPGAHGRFTRGGRRFAAETVRSPAAYVSQVQACGHGYLELEALTLRQAAEERLLMGLRTSEGVDLKDLDGLTLSRLSELQAAGLLACDGTQVTVTRAGRLVLDRVTGMLAE